MSITVGVIGVPNVGKSSLINSLKRSHVVNVGATPGLTRSMQEVQLDKKVKLLDCPGVVMLKSGEDEASVVLRNCKKVEKLDDPIAPVKEILRLCSAEKLMSLYKLPTFSSVDDFLGKVATLRGKLKKGGILDTEAAARIVLHDWNEGKIHYYTLPPVRNQGEKFEASVVLEFGREFNVDEVYKSESSFIGSLASVEDFEPVVVPRSSPLNLDEHMLQEDGALKEIQNAEEPMACDEDITKEKKSDTGSRQNDKLYTAEGILDPRIRRSEKKRRKARKMNWANEMDSDYDFRVDYFRKEPAPAPDDDNKALDESDGGDGSADEAPMVGIEVNEVDA